MRTVLIFLVQITFCGLLYSQKVGDRMIISEACNMYDIPSITGKTTRIEANDTITFIKLEDPKTGFYHVRHKDTEGYVNAIKIVHTRKLDNPQYRTNYNKSNREAKSLEELMEYYTSLYGKPDDSSLFITDVIKSRTLVWNCAQGKYRAINLKLEKGVWVKESETVSECVQLR